MNHSLQGVLASPPIERQMIFITCAHAIGQWEGEKKKKEGGKEGESRFGHIRVLHSSLPHNQPSIRGGGETGKKEEKKKGKERFNAPILAKRKKKKRRKN